MERFHEYLCGGHFEVYTDNNPLIYILTTAKLDATRQRWVASLAKYNCKIFYRSGKFNVEVDALSQIPWENTRVDYMEPLIVKTMLQSKLVTDVSVPEIYLQLNIIQKSMVVDSSPKLTHSNWIKEQSEASDINLIVQLLKSDKLKKYVAREMDLLGVWVLLKYHKDLFLRNGLPYWRVTLKNHQGPISHFVLSKSFICKVIFACHDDNGHLGMERTLGLLQERFFWPKMADFVHIHIHTCDRCLRFKQPQEKSEMCPILVSYPMELVHLDLLTLGGKADNNMTVSILIVTDHFMIYAQEYITSKQTAMVVARALWDNFLVHYGWPEKILTDQEKSFESNLIKELCELAQVKKLCTSPCHPETNGQCEHFNTTLINMLGTLPTHAKRNRQEWITTLTMLTIVLFLQ